jgi:hypothetical protein
LVDNTNSFFIVGLGSIHRKQKKSRRLEILLFIEERNVNQIKKCFFLMVHIWTYHESNYLWIHLRETIYRWVEMSWLSMTQSALKLLVRNLKFNNIFTIHLLYKNCVAYREPKKRCYKWLIWHAHKKTANMARKKSNPSMGNHWQNTNFQRTSFLAATLSFQVWSVSSSPKFCCCMHDLLARNISVTSAIEDLI